MRPWTGILAMAATATALLPAREAAACGGCFTSSVTVSGSQSEGTQVTGHRMMLAIHPESTSLWDQIQYSGNPESFAWVLPIKGKVSVGVSSDALFQVLNLLTEVKVRVEYECEYDCSSGEEEGGVGGGSGHGYSNGSAGDSYSEVTVLDQSVVGPYETVQLTSDDPNAIGDWLASHGYEIPDDIQPILDTYVQEGFGFLALKLVPGENVRSMRPVRVTFPGASPMLPLRMTAAGTGAVIPVNLWVVSDGGFVPANFTWFAIDELDVIWDFCEDTSNYAALRDTKFKQLGGAGWQLESSTDFHTSSFIQPLYYDKVALATYADADGQSADANFVADLKAMFADHAVQRMTRLLAILSRDALAKDLQLEALDASELDYPRTIEAFDYECNPPCPDYTCPGTGSCSHAGRPFTATPAAASAAASHTDFARPAVVFTAGLLVAASMRRRKKSPPAKRPAKQPPAKRPTKHAPTNRPPAKT